MYKNEFDTLWRQNKRFNAYMFFGSSTFLIESYTERVMLDHGSMDEIETVYFDEYNFHSCYNKLIQSSLFSSNNILVIKTEKKLPKKEVLQLIEACNANPDSIVIFCCLGENDFKTMAGWFSIKNKSVSIRLFPPHTHEAMTMLEEKAKALMLHYELTALHHLYFMHRQDIALSMKDLEKLSLLNQPLTSKLIDQYCFGMGSIPLEDFLYELFYESSIIDSLKLLLDDGMAELYVLAQITSFTSQLFMINTYTRVYGQANAKEIVGYVPPKAIWEKRVKLALSLKPIVFLTLFHFLNELELTLKTKPTLDKNGFFISSISKFSALLR